VGLDQGDISGMLLMLFITGMALCFCYVILFWDHLRARRAHRDDQKGFLDPTVTAVNYILVLGIPFLTLSSFVPAVRHARQLNLTFQDIHVARQFQDAQQRFFKAQEFLLRMDRALDDPDAPVWQEAKDYVAFRLGGETRFGRDVWQAMIDWGRQIEEDRGAADAAVADTRAVRAALARLIGADDLAPRIAEFKKLCKDPPPARDKAADSVVDRYISGAMNLHIYYPNDDIAYLAMADGIRRLEPRDKAMATAASLTACAGFLVFGLFIQRGMRLITVSGAGRCLDVSETPLFLTFEREAFDPRRWLCTFAIVFPATAVLAWVQIEPYYVLVYQQPWGYLAAVAWNVIMGGVLIESVGNILSVLLIRCGIDPLRTILDNVAVLLLSVPILLYFQNSWYSIAAGAALGLLPNLAQKARAFRRAGEEREQRLRDVAP
jgi:hypothetical protein